MFDQACHILDLPDDVLWLVVRRAGSQSCGGVCRAFRRVCLDSATAAVLTRRYSYGDSTHFVDMLARCPKLTHVDTVGPEQCAPWPTHLVPRLRSLTVPLNWPEDFISPALEELVVVPYSVQLSSGVPVNDDDDGDQFSGCVNNLLIDWVADVVADLDAAGSACVVRMRGGWVSLGARVGAFTGLRSDWTGWKSCRRLRMERVFVFGESMDEWGGPGGVARDALERLSIRSNAGMLRSLSEPPFSALRSLSFTNCPAVSSLRDLTPAAAPRLTSLVLSECDALTTLSAAGGSLPALRSLSIRLSPVTSLEGGLVPSLVRLKLQGCRALTAFRDPSTLRADGAAALPALESVVLVYCDALTSLAGLASLGSCTALDMCRCHAVGSLSGLRDAGLSRLRMLGVSGCSALTSLSGLVGSRGTGRALPLRKLQMANCPPFEPLLPQERRQRRRRQEGRPPPPVTLLAGLRDVWVGGTHVAAQLQWLADHGGRPVTEALDPAGMGLHDGSPLPSLSPVARALPALRRLYLFGCDALASLAADGLDLLRVLHIQCHGRAHTLATLRGRALRHVTLTGCQLSGGPPCAGQLPQLRVLRLVDCSLPPRLDLSAVARPVKLNLYKCEELADLDAVAGDSIQQLHVEACPNFVAATVRAAGLPRLRALVLLSCHALAALDLAYSAPLSRLLLYDLGALQQVEGMGTLAQAQVSVDLCQPSVIALRSEGQLRAVDQGGRES